MQDGTDEIWRPIPGFEGLYEVSDHGRVRSLPRKYLPTSHILRPRVMASGHLRVTLSKNGPHYCLVHRLVLWAFIGPQAKGVDVRHLDGVPTNNVLSNLCYGTRSENLYDMVRHGGHFYAKRTECPKCGGPYTWLASQNSRHCDPCYRERINAWRREWRRKRKEAGIPRSDRL